MSRRRSKTVARLRVDRQDGSAAELRATHRRGRVVVAERHGRRWRTTHQLDATPDTLAALRRQDRGGRR